MPESGCNKTAKNRVHTHGHDGAKHSTHIVRDNKRMKSSECDLATKSRRVRLALVARATRAVTSLLRVLRGFLANVARALFVRLEFFRNGAVFVEVAVIT